MKIIYTIIFVLSVAPVLPNQSLLIAQDTDEGSGLEQFLFEEIPMITIATKYAQKISDAPSIVTVVTEQMIAEMGARDMEDILRTVVGFDLVHFNTHKDIQIGIRGLSSSSDNNKVKIMINGHSLRSFNGAPAFYFNFIPVEMIERIEIIRGPGSALYGTSAFLGVINIVTKKSMDRIHKISTRAGSFYTVKPTGEISYQSGDLSVYAYGENFVTDGPRLDVESDFAAKVFGPDNSATPGKTSSNAHYNTFQTTVSYKNLNFTSMYHYQHAINMHIGLTKSLTDESEVKSVAYFGELHLEQPISDKSGVSVKAYFDSHIYDALYETFPEEVAEFFSNIYPDTPYPDGDGIFSGPYGVYRIYGGEATADYELAGCVQLLGGALYEHITWGDLKHFANGNVTGAPVTIDGVTYGPMQSFGQLLDISDEANWSEPASRNIMALYGQTGIDMKKLLSFPGHALTLTAGVRMDDYDDVSTAVNPRAGLVIAPISRLSFKALYGTAFRAPSFREMYNLNNPAFTGNPDILPEKITTMEFHTGIELSDHLNTGFTVFHSKVTDLLEIVGIQHENIGIITSQGAEFELKATVKKNTYGYINMVYQDVKNITHETITNPVDSTTYTQTDYNPGSIPEIIANVGINVAFTENIVANMSGHYTGERQRSQEQVFDATGNLVDIDQRDVLESQILVNSTLTLGHFKSLPGLELQLSVYNILDEDHRDPDPSLSYGNDIPRSGRTFGGKISFSF